jgi:FkbH-like protein
MILNWLPVAPDFSGDLRKALDTPDSAERLKKLASLAQYRLGFLETLQLGRALSELVLRPIEGFSHVRLAILASSTVDHIIPAIRVAGLRRGLLIDVYVGAYGQYRQEVLGASSGLHQFAPQIVLFSLTAREFIAKIPITASASEAEDTIAQSVDELRQLWRTAQEKFKATIVQQTFLDVTQPLFGSYDRLVPGSPSRAIGRLNNQIAETATGDDVMLLDVARASERDGIHAWFDVTRWLQGKLEISPQAAPLYGEHVARVVAAQRGLSKKCLVLDLDNTLWSGVVGDDGIDGIVLGEGSAEGEAHLSLQRYAKQLKERGVILAVCSKNDLATAEAVFHEHPDMLLRRSDIAAFIANWHDKAENLRTIAQRLNIGLDSLVFVDDNPVERARIRESLPMVAVPELPPDPAHYANCLAEAGYFEAVAFTSVDQQRAEQYAANTQREALRESSKSADDFLRDLKMSVHFGPFTGIDLARVTQLINKTNQFNPTTRRYSKEEVASFSAMADTITLQFRLVDKLGDNGIVSVMILRPDVEQPHVLDVDCWVMSCRVFGRDLEFEAMTIAVEEARRRSAQELRAEYIPSAKNAVISELYPSLGFVPASQAPQPHGATWWSLELANYTPRKTHIARR